MLGQRHPSPRNRMSGHYDCDMTAAPMPMIADGFSMNSSLRYLPYRSFPLALGQLDELRQARANYREKLLCFPFDVSVPIPARENFDAGQYVNPGSILWGFSFAALDGNASDFDVNITDICAEEGYFEETVEATTLRPQAVGTATNLFPVLTEPRVLSGYPISIRVVIANKAAVDQRCQFVVHLAEPCSLQEGRVAQPLPKLPRGV